MGRKRIAVLMASIDREYQRDFAAALSAEAGALNTDIFIFNCQGHSNHIVYTNDEGESAIFDLARMMDFDGIISLRETLADDLSRRKVEELLEAGRGKPHVSIDVPTNGAVNILFDDSGSVRDIAAHLIEKHGIRDFVYVSGPRRQIVAMNRLNTFRSELEAHGLVLNEEDVYDGEWIQRRGREIAMELLERDRGLPGAIVCGNDDMALGVVETLHEQGIRVPEDVTVTGFDALREALLRGLTTARRPIDRAARTALEVLNRWINGLEPDKREILMPTIPIYGNTCGCNLDAETLHERMWAIASERRNLEETLSKVSMFSSAMSSAESEADIREKTEKLARIWNIGEMYLCADPAISRKTQEKKKEYIWPESMLMLCGLQDGESLPIRAFPTGELLPLSGDPDRLPLCLIFCPLYYRDRMLGYLAIETGETIGPALYSLLMLLNGALLSLYLQSSLRFYGRRMEEMTYTDSMTGLLNRRGLSERAPAELEKARKTGKLFVMLSSDMNHMKQINDRFGHQMGDEAIRRMGQAMEQLREGGMTPVQISGDEFLAYGMAESLEEAEQVREKLAEALKRMNREDPWITEIRASIGVYAAVPSREDTLDDFLRLADHAMYEEKNRRKAAGE